MSYPTSKLSGLVGFAKYSGVTGGWSGSIVEVNSLEELNEYAADSTDRVLVINSDISASSMTKVSIGSNKTLVGSFENRTLENIYLRTTENSSNVIFQNITFQHSVDINANDDIQLYISHGSKFWIDHCSFIGHSWSDDDGSLDKLLYIGQNADYATISNCFFGNHKYGIILGHPEDDNDSSYDGYPHLTICHNYFENLEVRAPGLMRYGYFHVYSNYINNFHLGFTVAQNAKIISENNYFGDSDENGHILDDKGTGTFTDTGSEPEITGQTSPNSDWSAADSYSYTVKTAEEAKSFTTSNSGSKSTSLVFGT